jgi:glycosyl transferase family 25
MKAIVINLDMARQRMEFQKNQLDGFGIKFYRLSATSLNGFDDWIYKKHATSWERILRPAEVACFFSHKEAWNIVVKNKEPMLILEDDACLASNINCVLDELDKINDIDYVNLEITGKNKKKILAKSEQSEFCGSKLIRMYQGRSGAGGYVLWLSGARKLLNQADKEGVGLTDKFINANYSLLACQLDPAVVIQLDQRKYHGIKPPLEVESSITPSTAVNIKLGQCVKCRFRRIITQVKIALNYLVHLGHAQKRRVTISKLLFNLTK